MIYIRDVSIGSNNTMSNPIRFTIKRRPRIEDRIKQTFDYMSRIGFRLHEHQQDGVKSMNYKSMDYKNWPMELIDLYEGIFTEYECNHVIEQSKPLLSDALVSGSKEGFISPVRISSNCWLPYNKTSTIALMCEKISYITCSPLENVEKLQVIHYPEGGLYNPHYDGWDHDNSEKTKA